MGTAAELVFRLTQTKLLASERLRNLHEFAQVTGWHPSDEIEEYPGTEFANGHLLVEHGMANTAVISFLMAKHCFEGLGRTDQTRLLQLSYNNLVDWHLLPDQHGLTAVFNRTDPPRRFRFEDTAKWHADAFEFVADQPIRPELKALDDAVVSTISFWKRAIYGEVGNRVSNEDLAALFNVIFFIRALEDHRRLQGYSYDRLLVQIASKHSPRTLSHCCGAALRRLGKRSFPVLIGALVDRLPAFDMLARETVQQLVLDFYKNKYCDYEYDFSMISKHAMSRIYEHYVSLLRAPGVGHPELFPGLAQEEANRNLGTYYTPQFIARFFSRYIQQNTTPKRFRELRVADPSCGSGMFLRTIQEFRCDPYEFAVDAASVRMSFRNLVGIDIDATACEAARLSLSLLHLVLTEEFPRSVNIHQSDALTYLRRNPEERNSYGAIISNPPFIPLARQSAGLRKAVVDFLGDYAKGRTDVYLGLLKAGVDMLEPGGFGCFVLPHAFLQVDSGSGLRQYLKETCWVRLVADLSDLRVFENVETYTVLVIVQRKSPLDTPPSATVIECRGSVGYALSTALRGRLAQNEHFRVFELEQEAFVSKGWRLFSPEKYHFARSLEGLARLKDLAQVSQGIVTGADSVFIRDRTEVLPSERAIWRPLLSDREMLPFKVPPAARTVVFYPEGTEGQLTLRELRDEYPNTHEYLLRHKAVLVARAGIEDSPEKWWLPTRLRDPRRLFQPKIVGPHLMITPRFAFDRDGRYAVTRSTFVATRGPTQRYAEDLLLYILAFLNSPVGFWQLTALSHKYGQGYAMVEAKALGSFRIPDPSTVDAAKMKALLRATRAAVLDGPSADLEREIGQLTAGLFGLEVSDLPKLGL